MNFKLILLFIFSFSFLSSISAQKRTTSVKGYTRKDGTYVRSHTRSYSSGSGYSSYGSNLNGSYSSSDTLDSMDSKKNQNGQYLTSTKSINGDKIVKSTLTMIQDYDENYLEGNIIYLSVLYYKEQVIDICPITKNYSDWNFDDTYHSFNKNKLSSEDALDLISNYGWSIYNEKISKNFRYYTDKKQPQYLSKKIEAIKLK
ncbi:hypothetical protein [Chryseobacterium sp. BIGb0232]|uniref:hypothetical protein n=1 Tax=Chryseobacterium sp. BIGb0232 TaxID=2940598 RepID=UPI000F4805D3|nr:hypothetical protein [Chryseobacterium sp. BIGb0232]MCS4304247.1 2-oxoglutarate dehydrogenase complex dehydrogenase (E1) component-like enzyme [Chryseobacterium sp. BIGb0232]ROS14132.1 hypothetical protein EDF65_2898 [Chryseobacterium nakagawai]